MTAIRDLYPRWQSKVPIACTFCRAAESDELAAQQFLVALRPTLRHVVASVLGSWHPDVDDAIQLSSLALIRAAAAFRGECRPDQYASKIAFRVALKMRRKRRREWDRDDLEGAFAEERSILANDSAEINERRELLRDLVATLPAKQSEALTLRAISDCSLEEIARVTGAPRNTVRSRVRLAREALRHRIERSPDLAEALAPAPR
jgi:RNA polymerase sigma-70 factor (ECF subfamily)